MRQVSAERRTADRLRLASPPVGADGGRLAGPALLAPDSIASLREYLAFRHIVRNIYGFELDVERIGRLVERYPAVWGQVEADIQRFVAWLHTLADQIPAE